VSYRRHKPAILPKPHDRISAIVTIAPALRKHDALADLILRRNKKRRTVPPLRSRRVSRPRMGYRAANLNWG
jgi:hypothetical protein